MTISDRSHAQLYIYLRYISKLSVGLSLMFVEGLSGTYDRHELIVSHALFFSQSMHHREWVRKQKLNHVQRFQRIHYPACATPHHE